MAVIIKELNKATDRLESVGVVYDGEFIGDEEYGEMFDQLNLGAEGAEDELVGEFNSHHLQAVKIEDDEVDPDEYRE